MGSRVSFRIGGSLFLVLALAALTPTAAATPRRTSVSRSPDCRPTSSTGSRPERRSSRASRRVAEGIGPVFNDVSCANCHNVAAIGGGSAILETRFGTTAADGTFDPLTQFGGSLMQNQGIGAAGDCEYLAEIVPPEATITAHRRTTPLFGLGLVDAVPDSTFYAIATEESHNPDGIAGKVSVVTNISTGQNAGREVRLEVPEPEPLPVLRRRVPERDGHHEPAVSRTRTVRRAIAPP